MQAEHAVLDEVEERQAVPLVALRDRDDEAEVGGDQQVERLAVAALGAACELGLLPGGKQRVPADVVEEELERVGDRKPLVGLVLLGDGVVDRVELDVGRLHRLVGVRHGRRLDDPLLERRAPHAGLPSRGATPPPGRPDGVRPGVAARACSRGMDMGAP